MVQRERFFSCAIDEQQLDSIDGKNERVKHTTKPKRPIFKTRNRLYHQNQSKVESMIIAKHEYVKNLARSPKSKKRKRMDESIEVVDEIWSLDATIALKQLEKHANSKETSELITCFDVDSMERNFHEITILNMKRLMQTWNEKDKIMINAIGYVNNGKSIENIKKLKTEELITCLINSIRNRMPKMCRQCNDWYRIEKDNEPILRCTVCDVGIHECKKIDKESLVSGLLWMCQECSDEMKQNSIIEKLRMKLITKATSKTAPKDTPVNRKSNEIKRNKINERKKHQDDMEKI